MTRYFPEVVDAVRANLPERCVVDGEIVVDDRATGSTSRRCSSASIPAESGCGCSPSRPRLVRRVRPARARRRRPDRAHRSPSGGRRWRTRSRGAGHRSTSRRPPATRRSPASGSSEFEGAGLDGVVAKPLDGTYQPDKRVMFKIKHERTADCVVAGYRVHKSGAGRDRLAAARTVHRRRRAGLGRRDRRVPDGAPQRAVRRDAAAGDDASTTTRGTGQRRRRARARRAAPRGPGGTPARTCRSCRCGPERVVEVRYDHMEGPRFRHTAQFVRWRPDREPGRAPTSSSSSRSLSGWTTSSRRLGRRTAGRTPGPQY